MNSIDEHNNANKQKWDDRAKTYDTALSKKYFRFMQKNVIAMVELRNDTNFLDLGCGTGWAVCYVATLLRGRGQFIGVDISPGMIERSRNNTIGLDNVSFYVASSENIPLKDNFFDNIICTNSFHHYLNPLKALIEVRRVLKRQGKFYILDVTADNFLARWMDRRARKQEKEHVKFYSTSEYKDMFFRVGLSYVRRRSLGIGGLVKVHIAEK